MTNLAEGMKDLLVTAGVGVFAASSGWGIYIGKGPSTPDTIISIMNVGGTNPNPKWLVDFPSLQTMVRGAENGYQAAWTKATEVKDVLLGLESTDLNGDRWDSVVMLGDIASLGFDENNRVIFSLNWQLIIEPAASGLTNRDPL